MCKGMTDSFVWSNLEKKRRRCSECGRRRITVILFPQMEYEAPLCRECFEKGDFDK